MTYTKSQNCGLLLTVALRLGLSAAPMPIGALVAGAQGIGAPRCKRLGKSSTGLTYLLLMLIGLGGAFSTAQYALGQSSAPTVWVLHDEDPNYSNPTVGDTLSALDDWGQPVATTAGIDICQTIGAWRALSVTDQGRGAIVCEFCGGNRLSKFGLDGTRIFSVAGLFYAADVGSSGTIFALTSLGTIYGDSIYKISPQGAILGQSGIGGIDLAVDETHQRIYVVGTDIKCTDLDFQVLWTSPVITWAAVSVDVAHDGSVWVAERLHPDVSGSVDRLLHLSSAGTILNTINLAFGPFCVRLDPTDDSVYVVGQNLSKYDSHGTLLFSAALNGGGTSPLGWSVAVDHARQVWVGTFSDVRKFSPEGTLQFVTNYFSNPSDTFVAVMRVGNRPPVPVIEVSPLAHFPGWTNSLVIAPDATGAAVVFDGSQSYDPDDASFHYFWFEGANLFSTNPVATNRLALGTHTIELLLDDTFPLGTNSASVTVEVISPAEAVGIVVGLVDHAELPARSHHPLLTSLAAAAASFERGNPVPGINQLRAFQNKVRAQVTPFAPVLAEELRAAAEVIIDAVTGAHTDPGGSHGKRPMGSSIANEQL